MISVCIATYNGEAFIHAQLESILSQLHDDDEIIISDDGSTDNTLCIIRQYQDSRIHVISHHKFKEKAVSVWDKMTCVRENFEEALKYAKGDVIFISDQDDVWLPNKVQSVLDSMSIETSCIVHDCKIVNNDLHVINNSMFQIYSPCFNRWGWLWKSPFMGCCMAIRREVIQRALPIPINVEYDTWLGIVASKMGTLKVIHEPLILYRRHGNNISTCSQKSNNNLLTKLQRRYFVIKNLVKLW